MRNQEFIRFKKECDRLNADWQEYDIRNISYSDAMKDLHKKYGIVTKKGEKEQLVAFESIAEWYDAQPLEAKLIIPEGMKMQVDLWNCLVLHFKQKDYGFAMKLLTKLFKGNFMRINEGVIEHNKHTLQKARYVSLIGERKTTDQVLEELRKRQVYPKVLRNSYLRRDYLHYYNGTIFSMPKRDFKNMMQKQSIKRVMESE